MKKFTCPYSYTNPETGTRTVGVIQADTAEELREHMQAEMEASAGALTPANFTHPDVAPLAQKRAPFVPVEEKERIVAKLSEANAKLKAAGLAEVSAVLEAAVVEVTK